jgi:hypothetical protein
MPSMGKWGADRFEQDSDSVKVHEAAPGVGFAFQHLPCHPPSDTGGVAQKLTSERASGQEELSEHRYVDGTSVGVATFYMVVD